MKRLRLCYGENNEVEKNINNLGKQTVETQWKYSLPYVSYKGWKISLGKVMPTNRRQPHWKSGVKKSPLHSIYKIHDKTIKLKPTNHTR